LHLDPAPLIAAFIAAGATLKLADIYGEKATSPLQYIFATAAALIFSLLITQSQTGSSIMLGIMIGVAASRKVNQPNLAAGLILTLSASILIGVLSNDYSWLPFPPWLLIALSTISAADEHNHDRLSSRKGAWQVFRFRPLLKAAIIILALASQIQAIYAAGFLSFDLTYDALSLLAEGKRKP
jgi:hypothetical protein